MSVSYKIKMHEPGCHGKLVRFIYLIFGGVGWGEPQSKVVESSVCYFLDEHVMLDPSLHSTFFCELERFQFGSDLVRCEF